MIRFLFRHRRLDQILEGSPTTLIENGKLKNRALAKELLTQSEIATVAHRQGFKHLRDIETCILEPGGTFYLEGKTPPREELWHAEILTKIEDLSREIAELKAKL